MAGDETVMYAIGELKTELHAFKSEVKQEFTTFRTELTEQGKDIAKIKGGIALAAVLAGMVGAGIAKLIGGGS